MYLLITTSVVFCGSLIRSVSSLVPKITPSTKIEGLQPIAVRAFQFSSALATSTTTSLYGTVETTKDDGGDDLASMRAVEIKKELESYGISTVSFVEKTQLVEALEKARVDGLKPKSMTTTATKPKKKKEKRSSVDYNDNNENGEKQEENERQREERLVKELKECKSMKVGEMRKELESAGISTKSFFEKTDFIKALAVARVKRSVSNDKEGYAEYTNVEVLTDDSSGPRSRSSSNNQQQQQQQQQQQRSSSPFGGAGGPFGSIGGMGGMGNIADMFSRGASNDSGNPFGGANPFGVGSGGADMVGKAQEMMKNPKIMQLMMKAQENPKIMAAMQECISNPAAFAKYQNDPEVAKLIKELQKAM